MHVEALACGCPVVSTDAPTGPTDILENGRYGRLVPVGDPDALARAMDFHIDRIIEQYLRILGLGPAPA